MGEKGCVAAVLTLAQQHVFDERCREAACWALKNLTTDCGTCPVRVVRPASEF
jgi:hypothetical protein